MPLEVSAKLMNGLKDISPGKNAWSTLVDLCDVLVLREGYNCMQLVEQIVMRVAEDSQLSDMQKVNFRGIFRKIFILFFRRKC